MINSGYELMSAYSRAYLLPFNPLPFKYFFFIKEMIFVKTENYYL